MVVGAGLPGRGGSLFVGRHAEAALVGLTLDQTSASAPAALVLRGEPGIGKTRLLAEAVARAESKGQHVIWVRANALEARVPFGALSVALERAAERDPRFVQAAAAMRGFISADSSTRESARLSFGQICERFAMALVEAGETSPAGLVVDDVHVLDHESLALLGVILGRVAGRNVAFVCSARSAGRDHDDRAGELLARLAEWPDVQELHLSPLAETQVKEVLEHVFAKPVSNAVAEVIARRSGGNPLFVLEMAHSLSTLDLIDHSAPGVDLGAGSGLLHLSRHTALLQRLFQLTPQCRRVAQIVAVLHRVRLADLDLVAELARLDGVETAAAFDELERRAIIVSEGGQSWALFHPFVSEALYEDIGPAERIRLHRTIAQHLLHRRECGQPVDLMRLAWHVSACAEVGDVDAARILGEAAESIKDAGPVSAADLCQQAVALLAPDSPLRGELLSLRTRCLIVAGRPPDALESGRAALEAMAPGDERTRTATAVIGALFDVGRVDDARTLADEEVLAGEPSAFLLAQLAMMAGAQGDKEAAWSAMRASLAVVPRSSGEEVLQQSFLADAAMIMGAIPTALEHLERARAAAPNAGPNLHVYALSRRCFSLVGAGFLTEAAEATTAAEAALAGTGPSTYSAGVTTARIGIDWMRGEWDHVLAAVADARRDLEITTNAVIHRYLHNIEIEVRAARGQLREALALMNVSHVGGSITQSMWSTAGAVHASGDDDGARQILRSAITHHTDRAWLAHLFMRLIEVEHRAGRRAWAAEAFGEFEDQVEPRLDPRPWVRAMGLRAAALIGDDLDAALASVAVADAEGLVYDGALARLVAGSLDRDGTDHLVEAHDLFGTLGAEADRRRAAALLRLRGAKVPRRRRNAPNQLTRAEADIARLVQSGLRNRDIARTTSYSERTVEVYLSRIYAKLGVSSRLQLARLLDEQPLAFDEAPGDQGA